MPYNVLSVNEKKVHEIRDYVYQLYYCGQRESLPGGLPLLLNILTMQLGLDTY